MASFFAELKRRKVVRVAVVYAVVAWLIMQIADVGVPALLLPEWVGRAVALLLILGFPVALILAWAYDLTPKGITLTEPLAEPAEQSSPAIGGEGKAQGSHATPVAENEQPDGVSSIAVLPFVNISPDAENEFFSDGLTEELINALARIEGWKVAARTSSFYFKNHKDTIQRIGKELGVGTVVEGSVRAASGRVRVSAQLAKVDDGYQLWSGTFDRKLEDLLHVQDEIVQAIVQALKGRLLSETAEGAATTDNEDAYQAYLRGRYLWQRRDAASMAEGIELLRKAVALDPKFARAYASLAAAYHKSPLYGAEVNENSAQRLAESAARRALQLDPDLGEASATLGSILADNHQFVEAQDAFSQAMEGEHRDATMHHWYAVFLLNTGRLTAAREQIRLALDLDPLNAAIVGTNGSICFAQGQIDDAIAQFENASDLGWSETANAFQGAIYLHLGNKQKAREKLQSGRFGGELIPRGLMDEILAIIDGEPGTEQLGDRLISGITSGEISGALGFRLCALTGSTRIFDFSTAHDKLRADVLSALWYPMAAPIRRDERFAAFLENLGLPKAWRASQWPDQCRLLNSQIVCE